MEYWVYVLESSADKKHYVGYTRNVSVRLAEHNRGKCRYTKGHRPWKLVYQVPTDSCSKASALEKFFKTGVGRKVWQSYIK